jgi:hypothetical protein
MDARCHPKSRAGSGWTFGPVGSIDVRPGFEKDSRDLDGIFGHPLTKTLHAIGGHVLQ